MLQDEEILSRLTPIMQDCLENDDIVATPQLTAADVNGWDSLAHVRLILAIERDFKIGFSAGEVAGFKNVGDLVSSIRSKL
jgi:acyl carrier protein